MAGLKGHFQKKKKVPNSTVRESRKWKIFKTVARILQQIYHAILRETGAKSATSETL